MLRATKSVGLIVTIAWVVGACAPGGAVADAVSADVGDVGDAFDAEAADVPRAADAPLVDDGRDALPTASDAADVACGPPTPVIFVTEGDEVLPLTVLHLVGSQSVAACGPIAAYRWQVSQPVGSLSLFRPSATVADPTFEVNVAGRYELELTVVDARGVASVDPVRAEVFVNPGRALHVELIWDTPNDPDPTDEGPAAGADLDLHLLHPLATGPYDGDGDGSPDGWFDPRYDCYAENASPDWGAAGDAADDPRLGRSDPDGGGPESVDLDAPEAPACYRLGVHARDDHGFGPTFATLRVYVHANLVFELTDVELVRGDLWSATTICWPPGDPPALEKACDGVGAPCGRDADCATDRCELRVLHGYPPPSR